MDNWQKCLTAIKKAITSKQYETWFEPLTWKGVEGDTLNIQVPTTFFRDYFEQHLAEYFMKVARMFYGPELKHLQYFIDNRGEAANTDPAPETTVSTTTKGPAAQRTSPQQPYDKLPPIDPQLIARYTFDTFVEGESNKLPRTVALSIANNPGKSTFNPFFLYGPSGVGKTHLANAIGLSIRERYPDMRVLFVSAQTFKTQYTDSVRRNTTNDFLLFYQSIDVLIIDDIQGITTEKTQLAFFHIFNHLQQNNRQIIITCDRPPVLFEGIQERMLTRFKWGMVVEMERADTALRRAILEAKIRRDGLEFPPEVVDYIAQNVDTNIRDLEGITNSIMAYTINDDCEISLALARRVVARVVNLEKRELTADDITAAVCKQYAVTKKELASKDRKKRIALPRQVAMYLIYKYIGASYNEIGRLFGHRDHSTVKYAVDQTAHRAGVDKAFRREIEDLETKLRAARS